MTLAEIDTTVRKAIRGFGCPWGLAEEAGKSARWLASHGLPGAEAIAGQCADRAECCMRGGDPCALRLAAALADHGPSHHTGTLDHAHGDIPLLVLAQMGRTADALDCAYTLRWKGGEATVSRNTLAIEGTEPALPMTCNPSEFVQNGTPASHQSRAVDDEKWAALIRLSRRILVPATAASRAGAGAGTNDSD